MGMCFGVRRAIVRALAAAERQPLTIFGDLVHNEAVLADLHARGIRM
jgi:4-hydroxy-3-methylbut-2-enyl diphosphate reductase IspH